MRTRIPLIDDCRALSVAVPEAPSPSELPESDVPVSLARGELCVGAAELVDESIFALDRTELCVGVTKVAPELLDESPLALDPSPLPELLATHVKLGTVCPAESQF